MPEEKPAGHNATGKEKRYFMTDLKWIAWMLPLLFLIHDMEEIVFAKSWCRKAMKQHIPLPVTPFGNGKSTSGMALAVYEELLILLLATAIGNLTGFYGLWFGMFAANILHLVVFHILLLQLSYRSYVPGVITAWLTILPCCFILYLAQKILAYSPARILLWSVIGFVITFVNLKILHKNMALFEKLTC